MPVRRRQCFTYTYTQRRKRVPCFSTAPVPLLSTGMLRLSFDTRTERLRFSHYLARQPVRYGDTSTTIDVCFVCVDVPNISFYYLYGFDNTNIDATRSSSSEDDTFFNRAILVAETSPTVWRARSRCQPVRRFTKQLFLLLFFLKSRRVALPQWERRP